ncbi:type I secretion system permease/ATPase [Chthonobacter rhizosphaerae]|uniref:type I secretion system permease/ATPase n=1 Tax=Chthonobacter rhizosphaerae TaxID=2735553 RepID=UPI001FE8E868|nr:type I secretion system permease/ATPase [Chthonobacter rhizosphaerae]
MTVAGAIRTCRSAFLSIFIVSAVLNLLMLTGPLFMLQVYDRVLASASVPTLVVLSGIALGLYAFSGLLDILRSRAFARIGTRVHAALAAPVLTANIRIPILAGQRAAGVHPDRDLDVVRRFLASPGPAAIFDLPFMPFYFLLVFLFHTWLGVMALGGGVLIFALVVANEFTARAPTREVGQRTAAQSKLSETARRSAEVVTAMGMRERFAHRYGQLLAETYAAQERSSDRSNFYSSLIKLLRLVLQSAMLGLGAYLAIRQEITPGVMIASSIIMARALAPIEQAVSHWPAFVAARQASGRLNQALKQADGDAGTADLPLPRAELTVDQLATSAPGEPMVLLQGVGFALKAGDAVGVIGPSGSGKTSLARALVGVWPALKGAVRLDGSTLDQWTEADRGRFVGYLPQDAELFDGTVAENIARFDPNADMAAIVEAARLCGVHKLIAKLPDGYNCRVGEGGARLSAGQRQRLGLARALYGAPFLIVLDEPNSNLDVEGEQALAAAIATMRQRGSIVVVVAHRKSALAAVNKVLLIQNGQQAAFGDRDEILSKVALLPGAATQTEGYAHAV